MKQLLKFKATIRVDGGSADIESDDIAFGIGLCFAMLPFDQQPALLEELRATHERVKAEQPPGTE